nr:glycoside hydrolase family 2 TIM barrel-domain containing protein [uncultured Clostridium sp.]
MNRSNIDNSWLFTQGQPSGKVVDSTDENQGEPVNLPHDFTIETDPYPEAPGGQGTGYYGGGIGTYTKILDIPEEYQGLRILAEFDGIYMNATVGLNGHTITKHHHGYTPFHADLTPYIKPGRANRLTVTANNSAQPNARWYSGSGIYRHVDILWAPQMHIAPWGIFAYTSHIINGTAFVMVETTVENHTSENTDLRIHIRIHKEKEGLIAGTGKVVVHMPAGEKSVARLLVAVGNADLWDIDSPDLYRITAELEDKGVLLDTDSTMFGIRTISVDTKNGFMLNGRTIKLKGGCVHHDNGILGAVSFKDSEYRKMKLHKENGYNAIRCAHNPPSRDMLESCDRLGLLVINEAFDIWTIGKRPNDYSLYFEENWKSDMESFMLRDRNHPCIIMWSTGNEITERGGLSDGYHWAFKLADQTRRLDSTRPVINSVCSFFNGLDDDDNEKCRQEMIEQFHKKGSMDNIDSQYSTEIWADRTEAYLAPLDVAGYNYLAFRYEQDLADYPDRVICGTESRPMDITEYWGAVERYPHVIGDFVWTSYDYMGEAGIGKAEYVNTGEAAGMPQFKSEFPWRLAHCGDFDLCGFSRPQLAYRKIVWGSDETFIASHNPENDGKKSLISQWGWPECDNSWTWPGFQGKPVQVEVYSAGEEVELILNGKSIGRQPAGKENRYTADFHISYEPGILEAVSYVSGKKRSSSVLKTAGEPAGICVTLDKKELVSDGQSLCFAVVEIIDADGNLVPTAQLETTAKVEGAATLAAFGTGNPKSTENYTKGVFTSYKGRLLAIVRSGMNSGTAILTISIQGLKTISTEIIVN